MSGRGSFEAVDDFLELEEELTDGAKTGETYDRGNIVGAAKIPTEEVPDDYPVSIRTRQALHLDVETPDGGTVATYIEWPGEGSEAQRASNASGRSPRESDHVEELLDALGRSRDEFANIYGDRVALESTDGWHDIDPERTKLLRNARETPDGEWVRRGRRRVGAAVLAGALGLVSTTTVASSLGAILFLASMVAIPVFFYRDAGRLSEATTWTNDWQLLLTSTLPLLNVGFGAAYLLNRHLYLSGDSPSETRRVVRNVLFGGASALVLAILFVGAAPGVGSPTILCTWIFLIFAVYFDTHYLSDLGERTIEGSYGVLLTALLGPVGAVWYVLKESKTLD